MEIAYNILLNFQVEAALWTLLLFSWIISSPLGWILWIFIWGPLQLILYGPIALYSFVKGIYDFGPSHRKRLLWQILTQPEPPAEFWTTQYEQSMHRYNLNPVSRQVKQEKITLKIRLQVDAKQAKR